MEEALNINLSLHFLEQVIISLNRKEGHIPYRNSMMTMCLRDSLGGNCKTRMIATLSGEFEDVMESMSTCRFAQRVALVKNIAVKNEIEDHNVIIQKQKFEIEDLKSELAMVKGKDQKTILDKEDILNCRKIVEDYLADDDYKKKIQLKDFLMIQECFAQMKMMYKDLEKKVKNMNVENSKEIVLKDSINTDRVIELENLTKKLNAEIEKCKEIIKKRDEELKVLITNIDKNKQNEQITYKPLITRLNNEENKIAEIKNDILGNIVNFENLSSISKKETNFKDLQSSISETCKNDMSISRSKDMTNIPLSILRDMSIANSHLVSEIPLTSESFFDYKKAFEDYKKFHSRTKSNAESEDRAKLLFEKGKEVTVEITQMKEQIAKIKTSVYIIVKIDRKH
jgi:kinesin family protein 6/9